MTKDELYIQHCIDLAKISHKNVKSNPNVGAILVYNNTIIGQGYHEQFGGLHAERNAIASVDVSKNHLIKDSTLYVTLEPCMIHAKTPPCSDAILENQIKNLVISTLDPNPMMQGKSVDYLRSKGVHVKTGVLENKGIDLIRPFKNALNKLPYIILKYAQSSDAYFGKRGQQVWLSGIDSKILVHKWRTEVDAIIIGYHTALIDNPKLTDRYHYGESPMRIVLDNDLSLPKTHHLWADNLATIFISKVKSKEIGTEFNNHKKVWTLKESEDRNNQICKMLFENGFYRVILEGGASTIKGFVADNLWNEARIINSNKALYSGIRSPYISGRRYKTKSMEADSIEYVYND